MALWTSVLRASQDVKPSWSLDRWTHDLLLREGESISWQYLTLLVLFLFTSFWADDHSERQTDKVVELLHDLQEYWCQHELSFTHVTICSCWVLTFSWLHIFLDDPWEDRNTGTGCWILQRTSSVIVSPLTVVDQHNLLTCINSGQKVGVSLTCTNETCPKNYPTPTLSLSKTWRHEAHVRCAILMFPIMVIRAASDQPKCCLDFLIWLHMWQAQGLAIHGSISIKGVIHHHCCTVMPDTLPLVSPVVHYKPLQIHGYILLHKDESGILVASCGTWRSERSKFVTASLCQFYSVTSVWMLKQSVIKLLCSPTSESQQPVKLWRQMFPI